jgi:hypothetical protein
MVGRLGCRANPESCLASNAEQRCEQITTQATFKAVAGNGILGNTVGQLGVYNIPG